MEKKLLLIITCIFVTGFMKAQDLIVFKDGNFEQTKILEITDAEIKYKKWTNQNGPTFTTTKDKLLSITYSDGTKENFSQQQPRVQNYESNSFQNKAINPYQKERNDLFSVHIGVAIPLGSFGEYDKKSFELALADEDSENGGASVGFNIGLKGNIPVPVAGLGVIISADFMFNGLNSNVKKDLSSDGIKITKMPNYIHIPLMVGVNYKYQFNKLVGVWGEGALGTSIRVITPLEAQADDGESWEDNFKTSAGFAMQIGAGITIKEIFSVGLHYYHLGSSTIEVESKHNKVSGTENWDAGELSTNMFMLRLGLHFGKK